MGVFAELMLQALVEKRRAMVRRIALEAFSFAEWRFLCAEYGVCPTPEDEAWYRETFPNESP